MNSQALGLRRKIQNQRHSRSNLPFLSVPLCMTSYLIVLSVRGRKDDKCVEKGTDVQVTLSSDAWGSLSASHGSALGSVASPLRWAGSVRQVWPTSWLSEKGNSFISSLSSHAHFRNSWELQPQFGELA